MAQAQEIATKARQANRLLVALVAAFAAVLAVVLVPIVRDEVARQRAMTLGELEHSSGSDFINQYFTA